MRVITNVPIITENKSSCCGMSSFDNEGQVKNYLGAEKSKRKSFQKEYLGDVLADKSQGKDSRRQRLTEKREARQLARSERKEARFQRNLQRKAKKNSKRLALIKTQGKERYFFPVNRLRLGKKKYKDGTQAEIKKEDQLSIVAPSGENVVVDRQEVAKAIGTAPSNVTQSDAQRIITTLPTNTAVEQNMALEVSQTTNEPVLAVQVPDTNVEANANGELYVTTDLQNVNEEVKDVKEEEQGLSKNQKYLIWGIGIVAIGIIGYAVYRYATKGKNV